MWRSSLFVQVRLASSSKLYFPEVQKSLVIAYNTAKHQNHIVWPFLWKLSTNMCLMKLIVLLRNIPLKLLLKIHRFSIIRKFAEQTSFAEYLPSLLQQFSSELGIPSLPTYMSAGKDINITCWEGREGGWEKVAAPFLCIPAVASTQKFVFLVLFFCFVLFCCWFFVCLCYAF